MMVLNDDDDDDDDDDDGDCDKAPPLETLLAGRADRRTAAAYWFHRSHNGDAMPSGAIWKRAQIARNMERNIRCNR